LNWNRFPAAVVYARLRRSALSWLCVAALVFSQTLAALHGVAHRLALDGQVQAQIQAPPAGWIGTLLPDHDSAADCKAFDQLHHIDKAAGPTAVVLPLALFSFQITLFSGLATARWHAQFEARGPPASR
jgi:hypothetical protein